jgi:hypothetical protein
MTFRGPVGDDDVGSCRDCVGPNVVEVCMLKSPVSVSWCRWAAEESNSAVPDSESSALGIEVDNVAPYEVVFAPAYVRIDAMTRTIFYCKSSVE